MIATGLIAIYFFNKAIDSEMELVPNMMIDYLEAQRFLKERKNKAKKEN